MNVLRKVFVFGFSDVGFRNLLAFFVTRLDGFSPSDQLLNNFKVTIINLIESRNKQTLSVVLKSVKIKLATFSSFSKFAYKQIEYYLCYLCDTITFIIVAKFALCFSFSSPADIRSLSRTSLLYVTLVF